MIDTQQVKEMVDLRSIVEADLGKPHHKSAKYHAYRCPFHHETKGFSLTVYADGWQCHGKCQESGDAISWVMKFRGLTFNEAAQALAGNMLSTSRPAVKRPAVPFPVETAEPPDVKWQHPARHIVDQAQEYLWSDAHHALDYLFKRGLTRQTIEQAQLGYVPPRSDSDLRYGRILHIGWVKSDGKPVRVPCGITIPHFADDHLWAIRVRTDSGNPKYLGVAGGSKALYWSDSIGIRKPVLIVEGEFDCLIAAQVIDDRVSPVAIASASNAGINPRWLDKLITAPVILARMDADGAGAKALARLQELSGRIHPVSVPVGKDVNDYYLACLEHPTPSPRERFLSWLAFHLEVE